MALDRHVRLAFRKSEDFARSIDTVEPALRDKTRLAGHLELERGVELLAEGRASLDIPHFSSNSLVKSRELLVIAAEAAISNDKFEVAKAKATEFQLLNPPQDQFYARVLFVLAAVAANQVITQELNGSEATSQRLKAIDFVLRALEIAESASPRYDFITYNASIHYWGIARPMLRPGAARFAAESMKVISDGLERIDDHERAWRVCILSALARAQEDAGKVDASCASLEKAVAHCETLRGAATADVSEAEAALEEVDAKFSGAQAAARAEDVGLEEQAKAIAELRRVERARVEAIEAVEKKKAALGVETRRLERVLLQGVYLGHRGDKSANAKKLSEGCAGKLGSSDVFGERGPAIQLFQKIRCGLVQSSVAVEQLTQLISTLDPPEGKEEAGGEQSSDRKSGPPALRGAVAELVVEAGLLALGQGGVELSHRCLDRAASSKSMSPSASIKMDLLKAQLSIQEYDGRSAVHRTELLATAAKELGTKLAQHALTEEAMARARGNKNPKKPVQSLAEHAMGLTLQPLVEKIDNRRLGAMRLKQRVEAIKVLERSLLSCQRLLQAPDSEVLVTDPYDTGAVPLLVDTCSAVWNISLPLLQPHLRKHAHRALSLSAQLLASVDAPDHQLRSQLHLEAAKCEISSDFLAKAAEHLASGRLCDYGSISLEEVTAPRPSEELLAELTAEVRQLEQIAIPDIEPLQDGGAAKLHENEARRPLDAHILPLEQTLSLKKSIYQEPDSLEERAVLVLEQAKEAPSPQLQKTMLFQAADLLSAATNDEQAKEAASSPEGAGQAAQDVPTTTLEAVLVYASSGEDGNFDHLVIDIPSSGKEKGKAKGKGAAGGSDGDSPQLPPPAPLAKIRSRLWYEVLELGWNPTRSVDLVHRAVKALLSLTWDPVRYAPFVVLQCEAQFTLAQTLVYELEHLDDREILQGAEEVLEDVSVSEEVRQQMHKQRMEALRTGRQLGVVRADQPEKVKTLKQGVVGAIAGGIRRAMRLASSDRDPDEQPPDVAAGSPLPGDTAPPSPRTLAYRYLVENGAIMLWNLHLPILQSDQSDLMDASDELVSTLQLAERCLRAVQSEDSLLFANIAEALARVSAVRGEGSAAECLCRRAMLLCRPMHAKPLVQLRARLVAEKQASAGALQGNLNGLGARKPAHGKRGYEEYMAQRSSAEADPGTSTPATASSAGVNLPKFDFDPAAPAPSFDERAVANAARAVHFEVLIALENIAVGGGSDTNFQGELDRVVGLLYDDKRAAVEAADAAAQVAAHRVYTVSRKAGGGSLGVLAAAQMMPKIVVEVRGSLSMEEDEELLELRVELWTRVAADALAQGQARLAQACCREALGVAGVSPAPKLLAQVPARVWRWWSVARRVWASAVAAMVSPTEQERQTQEQLRAAALQHLVDAADAAQRSPAKERPRLCLEAAQLFWNIAVPMMSSPASRKRIRRLVQGLTLCFNVEDAQAELGEQCGIGSGGGGGQGQPGQDGGLESESEEDVLEGSPGGVRMRLFALLFECLADVEKWKEGMEAIRRAFALVPPSLQRPIWQWKVVFQSKLGQSALDGMAKMKESDSLLQARVWSALGQAATDRRQQLLSHCKALELLEKDDRVERAEFLIEYGEWCLAAGLPKSDGRAALQSGLDVLLDLDEERVMELEARRQTAGAGLWEDLGSRVDGRSSVGTATNRGGGSESVRSSQQRSARSGTARSVSASERSTANSQTGKGRGHRRGGTVQLAEQVAGSLDASQLDATIRALTMLARLGPTAATRREYALRAVYYAERALAAPLAVLNLWRAETAFAEMGEDDKANIASQAGVEELRNSVFCRYALRCLESGENSELISRLELVQRPVSFAEYSRWTPSPELVAGLKQVHGHLGRFVPTARYMSKAPLTLRTLNDLCEVLGEEGLHFHCLPVTSYAEVVVRLAVAPELPPLVTLVAYRAAKVRAVAGDNVGAEQCVLNAPLAGLSNEAAQLYLGDVEMIEEQERLETQGGHGEEHEEGEQKSQPWRVQAEIQVRQVWGMLAQECAGNSHLQLRCALEYLEHAARHNKAFKDPATHAGCLAVKAQVETWKGCFDSAAQDILQAQQVWRSGWLGKRAPTGQCGASSQWADTSLNLARALEMGGDGAEALRVLKLTYAVLGPRAQQSMSQLPEEAELAGEPPAAACAAASKLALAVAEARVRQACTARRAVPPGVEQVARGLDLNNEAATGSRAEALRLWKEHSQAANAAFSEALVWALKSEAWPEPVAWVATATAGAVGAQKQGEERINLSSQGVGAAPASLQAGKICMSWAQHSLDMAEVEAGERAATGPTTAALVHALNLLRRATACLKTLHHSQTPSFEQLSLPGEGGQQLSTPASRLLGWAQLLETTVTLQLAVAAGEHKSKSRARLEYDQRVTDMVERWIDATAPPPTKPEQDLPVSNLDASLLLACGSERLLAPAPLAAPRGALAVGRVLLAQANHNGLLDDVWDSTSTAHLKSGSETPSGAGDAAGDGAEVMPGWDGAAGPLAEDLNDCLADQALAKLLTAAEVAAEIGDWEVVGEAAFLLAELHGNTDPVAATEWLLLHQSCHARSFLAKALVSALDPESKLAVFLRQAPRFGAVEGLDEGDDTTHPVRSRTQEFLRSSAGPVALKRLDCTLPTRQATQTLPPGFWALSLQLSPDKDALLLVLVDRESMASEKEAGDAEQPTSGTGPPLVWKQPVAAEAWRRLMVVCRRMEQWAQQVGRFLTKYGDDLGADGDFYSGADVETLLGDTVARARKRAQAESAAGGEEGSVTGGDADGDEEKTRDVPVVDQAEIHTAAAVAAAAAALERDGLESELLSIAREMDDLFTPALEAPPVAAALDQLASSAASEDAGEAARLLLLPDTRLAHLPLELLGPLRQRGIRPAGRDFSLHVFASRFAGTEEVEADSAVHVSPESIALIADPRLDDTGSSNKENPRPGCLSVLSTVAEQTPAVATWQGVRGDERIPSTGEWQNLLRTRTSGGYMYYGPGSSLAHLSPRALAGLEAPGCRLVVLVDRMENEVSFRRRCKEENQKTSAQIQLEQPLETAALYTLAGASTVVFHLWASSFFSSARFLGRFISEAVNEQADVAAALASACPGTEEPSGGEQQGGSRPGSKGSGKTSGKGSRAGTPNKKGRSKPGTPNTSEPVPPPISTRTRGVKARVRFNPVLYGVPTLYVSAGVAKGKKR